MDIHDLIELGFRSLIERLVQRSSGVVYEVIESVPAPNSKHVADFADEAIKQADISGVELKCGSFPSNGFYLADDVLGFSKIRVIREENVHAPPGEIDRRVAPEPAASAGDDCCFVVSIAHNSSLLAALPGNDALRVCEGPGGSITKQQRQANDLRRTFGNGLRPPMLVEIGCGV